MSVLVRLRRLPRSAVDATVAAAVAWPTAMDAWWNEAGTRQADALTYLLVAVSVGALLVRRRCAVPVALVTGAALSGLYLLGHHGELLNLPVMVALYTVAAQGDRRTTVVTGVVASAWSGVLGFTSDDPLGARGGSPVLEMLWPLVPLLLGEAVRSRRELAALAAAERERETRARMAREVHDVVAHTLTGVNVSVSAAVAALDADPEAARRALLDARRSGREAVAELRAAVRLLRGDEPGTAPAPTLAQLPELTRAATAAGVEVTILDERLAGDLPDAVELAAYRIVQEALTNVVRHSRAATATVSLGCGPEGLVVEVTDDGEGPGTGGSGLGLVGMAERARSLGGWVEHGPGDGGGFRVRATLPAAGVSP